MPPSQKPPFGNPQQMLWNFSPQKNHPNLRLCSGSLLGNERRRPKSEMVGFSQPGRALRRFRGTMSAHASKPSNFLCSSLTMWCQGYFRNLFIQVYCWMEKKVIMAHFAEDNTSNRPRKKFDPKKSTGTLVGAWLGQGLRGPRMGVWIRRGWMSLFWGAPTKYVYHQHQNFRNTKKNSCEELIL